MAALGLAIGLPFIRRSGGEPFIGPFDTFTSGVAAMHSHSRRMLSSYEGPLIRVRRSSDNTETDIGADGLGNLDESALLAFVSSGSGYVKTVYDQSGNGRNYGQSISGNQPRIVASGIVDLNEGVPAARCGLSDNFYSASSAFAARTLLSTAQLTGAVTYAGLVTGSSAILIIGGTPQLRYPSSDALQMRYNGASYSFDSTPFCYQETGCNGLTTNGSVNEVYMWGSERGIPGRYFDGYLNESVIYSNVPSFLADVEAEMMNHLGIS